MEENLKVLSKVWVSKCFIVQYSLYMFYIYFTVLTLPCDANTTFGSFSSVASLKSKDLLCMLAIRKELQSLHVEYSGCFFIPSSFCIIWLVV